MKISKMTLSEIEAEYPDAYIDTFDAGTQYDGGSDIPIQCIDVIVWPDEESSVDDDGENAIARYLIRA